MGGKGREERYTLAFRSIGDKCQYNVSGNGIRVDGFEPLISLMNNHLKNQSHN